MANTSSAKKMVRKIAKRTDINRSRRSRMRTFLRKVEEAIATGDQAVAQAALRAAQPEIMRGFARSAPERRFQRLRGERDARLRPGIAL